MRREAVIVAVTVAIHIALGGGMELASEYGRSDREPPPPRFEMVKLDTRRAPPPPPPPAIEPPPPPPPPAPTAPRKATPQRVVTRTAPTADPPPTTPPPTTPPPTAAPNPTAGGAPVVTLPDIAPAARGVAVASGTPTERRTGQGGTGGGTGDGTGTGTGAGAAPIAKVVSVASIKRAAMPRGDYDYFDAARQYPAEARQLGVGGVVRVQLTIDDHGKVVKVRLLGKGLGHGLDELALTRARALTFDPAIDTEDRPVTSVLTWTFRFEVPS